MRLEVIVMSVTFLLWMFSMNVARNKSWKVLDITQLINVIYVVLCFIALLLVLAVYHTKIHGFVISNQIAFAPIIAVLFYLSYVVIPPLEGSRKDLFKINKWNGLVLLTSLVMAVVQAAVV